MARLMFKAWDVFVDFTWGVVDGVLEPSKNNPNSTPAATSGLESKVLNICHGGAAAYTARSLIKDLIIGANPILLNY